MTSTSSPFDNFTVAIEIAIAILNFIYLSILNLLKIIYLQYLSIFKDSGSAIDHERQKGEDLANF